VDQAFQGLSVEMHFNVNGNGQATGVSSSQENFAGGNTVTYNVSADSFAVSVSHPSVTFGDTFGPVNIDAGTSNATLTVYEKNGGDRVFIMLNPDDPELDLSYVTFGNWTDANSTSNSIASGFVVFGVRTPAGAVPTTGTASYAGETIGTMVDSRGTIYTVSGFGTMTANFGAGTVNGDFTKTAKFNVLTTSTTPWRDFTTTGNISGNTFAGTAATKDGALTGTSNGGFFGPAANEIGGVYRMTGGGEQATGSFVGKK
jgi:hypothetical protein